MIASSSKSYCRTNSAWHSRSWRYGRASTMRLEFSSALEPHLIRLLLDRGASAVVFTDADTCFYAPVDDLPRDAAEDRSRADSAAIRPVVGRRYFPVGQLEYGRITNGLFNTGLLAVGPTGRGFLDWWGARWPATVSPEPEAGMLADQIWLDWAPLYFEHRDRARHLARRRVLEPRRARVGRARRQANGGRRPIAALPLRWVRRSPTRARVHLFR